jgi:HAD superfamily hydrolase (TIGR01509 family)
MPFTVFWDNDGVLVDTEALYFQSNQEVLATAGIALTRDFFVEQSLTRGESVFDLAEALSNTEREELVQKRDRRYSHLLRDRDTVLPGVRETLGELHHEVDMGVVTGSRRDHFEIIHQSSGLLQFFQFVLTREDYRRGKPHADAYRAALTRRQVTADECVVVEDSVRGAQAAIAAGLRCIVIPNELTKGASFPGAHVVLDSVRAVPPVVRALAGI